MDLLADTMDFNKKRIWINSIYFDKPFFQISDYTGNRDKLGLTITKAKIISLPKDKTLRWNPDGWVMNLKNLRIQNGTFVNDNETDRTATASSKARRAHARPLARALLGSGSAISARRSPVSVWGSRSRQQHCVLEFRIGIGQDVSGCTPLASCPGRVSAF